MAQRTKLFSTALSSAMQECGLNQVQLSRQTGIAVSRINNYLKGRYRTINPAHAAAIHGALEGSATGRAALCHAYLFDLLPENCRGLVEIRVAGAKDTGRWQVPSKGVPKDFAAALQELYVLCVSDVKVRERTAEWIGIMRESSH